MAETVAQVVANIRSMFDVDDATALRALDRRHKRMCARSRCYRKTVAVGTTTAGTAFYAVAGVIELYSLNVGGVPYGKARHPDVYGYSQGTLLWCGPAGSGLIVADADSGGVNGVTLIPTPGTSGVAITSFAAVEPPDLTLDGSAGGTFKVDSDLVEGVEAGAMAALADTTDEREDLATRMDGKFDVACEEQRRRTARRFRGPGPSQIRVQGINA